MSLLRVDGPRRGGTPTLRRSQVSIRPTAAGQMLGEQAAARHDELARDELARERLERESGYQSAIHARATAQLENDAGLRAARADHETLRAGGWVVGGRPVGGGFVDQRAAASTVAKFGALAAVHSRTSSSRSGSRGGARSASSGLHARRRHAAGAGAGAAAAGRQDSFAALLERPTFVEPSWREQMLHQMRNPQPQQRGASNRRASSAPPTPLEPAEPLEVAAQKRAAIRKEEQIAVVKHALQVGKTIRTQHKMKNASQFGSLEELEKYEKIAREARPKLEARMKALAERDVLLDPQNIIHRRNPAGESARSLSLLRAVCRSVSERMLVVCRCVARSLAWCCCCFLRLFSVLHIPLCLIDWLQVLELH